MLTPEQTRLYVRQLLLAEIGDAGQARLCGTRVALATGASAHAADIACDYLARAGVMRAEIGARDSDALALDLPDATGVERLSGHALLSDAAATLAGAFAAVEAIKAIVGVGRAARLPTDLVLAEDPS